MFGVVSRACTRKVLFFRFTEQSKSVTRWASILGEDFRSIETTNRETKYPNIWQKRHVQRRRFREWL